MKKKKYSMIDEEKSVGAELLVKIRARFAPYVRQKTQWSVFKKLSAFLVCLFLLPIRAVVSLLAILFGWILALFALRFPCLKPVALKIGRLLGRLILLCFGVWHIDIKSITKNDLLARIDNISSTKHQQQQQQQTQQCTATQLTKLRESIHRMKDHNPNDLPSSPFPLISNHLGYIDIIALFSCFNCVFVAKHGLSTTPIFGTIAKAIGCLFTNPDQSTTSQIISHIHLRTTATPPPPKHASHQPQSLLVFPEGTTTNGRALLCFRSGIFAPGLPIHPILVNCPNKHFSLSWETIHFHHHLIYTMMQLVNKVELTHLPMYVPSQSEISDPRYYAANVAQVMSFWSNLPIHPLNRQHKTVYHQYLLGIKKPEEVLSGADEIAKVDQVLVDWLNKTELNVL